MSNQLAGNASSAFPDAPFDAFDIEIQRIAATRAALNPDRRRLRADILLSAVVEFLATKGDRTLDSLVEGLNQIWRTQAVSAPELEPVLKNAQQIGLITALDDLTGVPKWQATPGAISESREDRDWAHKAIEKFEAEIAERLIDQGFDTTLYRPGTLGRSLMRALADGCEVSRRNGLVGVDFLRPVGFSATAVFEKIRKTRPVTMSNILMDLA